MEVRNRFKGLDLIDKVPDELWMEVRDIIQETGFKTIPMEKKCKKAQWISGEALQIAVKRRELKSEREKERYKHLNTEFQRRARRDRKPSSVINAKKYRKTTEWEKLESSSRQLEITREHFMQRLLDRGKTCMDLTEAEDIKKRGQEYTEELYKKDLHDQDNHDSVIVT